MEKLFNWARFLCAQEGSFTMYWDTIIAFTRKHYFSLYIYFSKRIVKCRTCLNGPTANNHTLFIISILTMPCICSLNIAYVFWLGIRTNKPFESILIL